MAEFSETVMDHFLSPRNQGRLESPTAVGVAGSPGHGPYLVLQLVIEQGLVQTARFQSHNCGATVASGSMLTELVSGKSLDQCRRLTTEDLLDALNGLPPHKRHCADFAMSALVDALK
jgi:NifU-like protein involved in Fe-S cluster formation